MKAVRVNKHGPPDALKVEEVPVPTPSNGQVLVKLLSTGINPVETYIRAGVYPLLPQLPYTPGKEGSGEITALGEGVSNVKVGDRVWLTDSLNGTYAQYTLSSSTEVHPLPKDFTYDQGAAVWIAYGTAYHALYHIGQVKEGAKILVHGASGGVGIAALQLARRIPNTFIVGTAGTDEGLKLVTQNGAKAAFNHRKEGYLTEVLQSTNGTGFDIILEMLANVNLGKDLPLLAKNGRVVVIGNRGSVEINARELMGRRASIHGVALNNMTREEKVEAINAINEGLKDTSSQKLSPLVAKSYKLEEAPKAHEEIINPPKEQGGAQGKLVFHPWE